MGANEIELDDAHDRSITVQARDIDTAAMVAGEGAAEDLDPKVAERLRRKIDRHLLPLMCCTFLSPLPLIQNAVLTSFQSHSCLYPVFCSQIPASQSQQSCRIMIADQVVVAQSAILGIL